MNAVQLCGAVGVMLLIIIVGVRSGRKVKSAADFASGGGKAGPGLVLGMIMGTMVGGACTIGTVQLAYEYGIAAWWYTLGSGMAALAMALFYVKWYRNAKTETIGGVLQSEFGMKSKLVVSLFWIIGSVLGLSAQIISATTIIPYVFPGIGKIGSLILIAVLTVVYVIFGGAMGAGEIGKIKIVLLYATIVIGSFVVLRTMGVKTMWDTLDRGTYFNLFSQGVGAETGKALSLVLGISCSQNYMQAIRMARSERTARVGLTAAAIIVPLAGAGGVLIGMFMRINHPGIENTKDTFTQFILQYMPDWLSGIFIGALLLVIIGCGAGGVLSAANILARDVIQPLSPRFEDERVCIDLTRLSMVVILAAGCIIGSGLLGDVILTFSFLASRIKAAAVFTPLMCAFLFPGKVLRSWAYLSSVIGVALAIIFAFWEVLPVDSMFVGILGSILCCVLGAVFQRRDTYHFLRS